MRIICMLATALSLSVSLPNSVEAKTWNCNIQRENVVARFNGVTPTKMRVSINSGRVTVSNNVLQAAGLGTVEGKLGRRIGNVQLFNWRMSPVPRRMLPPTETKFYEPTVLYRARLDLKTGNMSMRGSFITRVSSANTGLNMKGAGRCR